MVSYAYRCADCGAFEVARPMGTAAPSEPCPRCRAAAPRVYTGPLVARTPVPLRALRAREDASRDQPQVVTREPRPRPRPVPAHPAWSRLPRR